ncbi:hypothetical protein PAPHI01_0250 [Pancytospora philotis]|nr:hypothetical protein PAPHI01_0250 [Pancytospora philotis]
METEVTRRRGAGTARHEYPLVQRMVVLLRSYKDMKGIATNVGLALRGVMLSDFALQRLVTLSPEDTVQVQGKTDSAIENEVLYKLSQCRYSPKLALKAVNGELARDLGVKKLRSKVYAELAARGVVRVEKTLIYKKIILVNLDVWQEVYSTLVDECRNGAVSMQTRILLIGLNYINRLETLLVQCNRSDAACIISCLEDSKQRIRENLEAGQRRLVYEFLATLVK